MVAHAVYLERWQGTEGRATILNLGLLVIWEYSKIKMTNCIFDLRYIYKESTFWYNITSNCYMYDDFMCDSLIKTGYFKIDYFRARIYWLPKWRYRCFTAIALTELTTEYDLVFYYTSDNRIAANIIVRNEDGEYVELVMTTTQPLEKVNRITGSSRQSFLSEYTLHWALLNHLNGKLTIQMLIRL